MIDTLEQRIQKALAPPDEERTVQVLAGHAVPDERDQWWVRYEDYQWAYNLATDRNPAPDIARALEAVLNQTVPKLSMGLEGYDALRSHLSDAFIAALSEDK